MVDDNFISPERSKTSLDCRCDRPASIDISDNGSIFGVVAVVAYQII